MAIPLAVRKERKILKKNISSVVLVFCVRLEPVHVCFFFSIRERSARSELGAKVSKKSGAALALELRRLKIKLWFCRF